MRLDFDKSVEERGERTKIATYGGRLAFYNSR